MSINQMMQAKEVAVGTKGGCGSDVCGLKYISHRHRFIYFEVPKTGTSSLLTLLTEHAGLARTKGRFEAIAVAVLVSACGVQPPQGVATVTLIVDGMQQSRSGAT